MNEGFNCLLTLHHAVLTAFLTSSSTQNITHNFPAHFQHRSMIPGLFNHYECTKNETPFHFLISVPLVGYFFKKFLSAVLGDGRNCSRNM